MTEHEPLFPRAWRETETLRGSRVLWLAAVFSGAALAVALYFVAPGDGGIAFAIVGLLAGFFGAYALAVIGSVPATALRARAIEREREAEWASVKPVVRRGAR
jgi:hypothetical protein